MVATAQEAEMGGTEVTGILSYVESLRPAWARDWVSKQTTFEAIISHSLTVFY